MHFTDERKQLLSWHACVTVRLLAVQVLGHPDTLAYEPWPQLDESLLVEDTFTLPVQVRPELVQHRLGIQRSCAAAWLTHVYPAEAPIDMVHL